MIDTCNLCGEPDSDYYVFRQAIKPKYHRSRYVNIGRCCNTCYRDSLIMNLEYEHADYHQSNCFKDTHQASIATLNNKLPIIEAALSYWKSKNDVSRISFFENALADIDFLLSIKCPIVMKKFI